MESNSDGRHRVYEGILVCILFLSAGQFPIIGLTRQFPESLSPQIGLSSDIIRVSTNLVTLPVSVTDPAGQAVSDLSGNDFSIEEDGRLETVSRVSAAGQSPLQLALLVDLSGSLSPRFQFEQHAARSFLEKVWKPGDSVSLIAFSGRPQIHLQASHSLADALRILTILQPTEGPTAFFDSVILSTRLLRQTAGPETRQSVVALSDGEDNRSEHGLSKVLGEIRNSDAIFYSINPAGTSIRLNEISSKAQADLDVLARETGGRAFLSDQSADLEDIFRRIASDLRAQYLLSYYSSNTRADGGFRQIMVSIPQRPDLHVRTRRGYYAARH